MGNDSAAISAGWRHGLALKSNGSMVGWGGNFFGQATPGPGTNFVAVAGGSRHSLVLRSNGSLTGWGRNEFGEASVPIGNDYVAISAGLFHGLAIQVQPPVLNAARVGNNVVLSWSTNHIGYRLEANGGLNSPLDWAPVPAIPTVLGGNHTITHSAASGSQFFRLKR